MKKSGSIKINDSIPIPSRELGTGLSAALRELKVGQSFLYHNRVTPHFVAKQQGIKICTRGEGKVYRVWRIA